VTSDLNLTESKQGCRPQIRAHIEKHLGPVSRIFHQDGFDILCVEAVVDRPIHTLITAGMSDAAMNTGGKKNAPQYIELMMSLPEQWPLEKLSSADSGYWPIRLLAQLAVMPQQTGSALAWGDVIPNGDPAMPYTSSSGLCGCVLAPSLLVPKEFYALDIAQRHIEFYAAIPLFREELQAGADQGMEFLLSALLDHRVNDLVDPARRNVMKKRFGFF